MAYNSYIGEEIIRIAIIGTGGQANGHAIRYNAIKGCRVTTCCDIVPGRAKEFAEKHGIPASYQNAEEMFRKESLDGVAVVTSDTAHAPMALLAARYGVNIMCEKPLATSLKDARLMAAAARKKKLITAMNFSWRDSAAAQKAAELVAAGALGRIVHVEGCYLQSWLVSRVWGDWRTTPRFLWRLSTRHGSMGALGDIGVHLYDLADFVAGEFAGLSCSLKTFDKGKKRIGEYVFDVNDSAVTIVHFRNGGLGTFHVTRWAAGRTNTIGLRVYGDKGALDLNLCPAPEHLLVCRGKDVDTNTWKPIVCPPVPDMYQRFVTAMKTGRQGQTGFEGGVRVQSYLDASMISAEKGDFIKIR